MKKILIPVVAGLVIGVVVGILMIWAEFNGAEEIFTNYRPEGAGKR